MTNFPDPSTPRAVSGATKQATILGSNLPAFNNAIKICNGGHAEFRAAG